MWTSVHSHKYSLCKKYYYVTFSRQYPKDTYSTEPFCKQIPPVTHKFNSKSLCAFLPTTAVVLPSLK